MKNETKHPAMYSRTLLNITCTAWIPICKTGDYKMIDVWMIPAGTLVELQPQEDDSENMREGGDMVSAEVIDGPLVGMRFHCVDGHLFVNV